MPGGSTAQRLQGSSLALPRRAQIARPAVIKLRARITVAVPMANSPASTNAAIPRMRRTPTNPLTNELTA